MSSIMKYKKEFKEDNPQTIGETDSNFDLDNYKDWLENKYDSLLEANKELLEALKNILEYGNTGEDMREVKTLIEALIKKHEQ